MGIVKAVYGAWLTKSKLRLDTTYLLIEMSKCPVQKCSKSQKLVTKLKSEECNVVAWHKPVLTMLKKDLRSDLEFLHSFFHSHLFSHYHQVCLILRIHHYKLYSHKIYNLNHYLVDTMRCMEVTILT